MELFCYVKWNFESGAGLVGSETQFLRGDWMLQTLALWRPPAPIPRAKPLGPVGLLRVLATNPLEAWTDAHFEEPVVSGGLPFARAVVVSEPRAVRRVLRDNAGNYEKDWLQRRI